MLVRLKPIDQVVSDCDFSEEKIFGSRYISVYDEKRYWIICDDMIPFFGNVIDVEENPDKDYFVCMYSHVCVMNDKRRYVDKKWFMPNDFISEEEFLL